MARLTVPVLGLRVAVGLGVGLASLLAVPGFMLAMRWTVAVPAWILEGAPLRASLARSVALTHGNRWVLLGLAVARIVLVLLGLALITYAAVSAYESGRVAVSGGIRFAMALGIAAHASISATFAAVCYAELCRIHDGAAPGRLAAVFA